MQFEYDPGRGLVLPFQQEKYRAGPNPDCAPPLDPCWVRRLNDIGARIGRKLRWYWMLESRIWGVQQLNEPKDIWQTVFCNYDEHGQWKGNEYPYRPIDERALKEFCESCLMLRYGTGDTDADHALQEAEMIAADQAKKASNKTKQTELIRNVISGGDPKRFGKLLRHEEMHNGPGVRFQDTFQVHPNAPVGNE